MTDWKPDSYMHDRLTSCKPQYEFKASEAKDWQRRLGSLRTRFRVMLGELQEDRLAPNPVLLESTDCGDYRRDRIELTTFPGLRMPVYLLHPKQPIQPSAAVIACHGHGFGSKEIVGLNSDGTSRSEPTYQKDFAVELVRNGFVTIAPDLLGFGDRKLEEDRDEASSCHRISTMLLAHGQTMAGYRVYETMRCVDYALELDNISPERIGIMGISGGGLVASFTAMLDDRIRAAVVSGYLNTFQTSILAMHHCVDNFVPGLSLIADMPELFGLIAPRPLLIEAGEDDPIFPIAGVMQAYDKLRGMYDSAGAGERIALDQFQGDHQISGAMAYSWLNRWLREGGEA